MKEERRSRLAAVATHINEAYEIGVGRRHELVPAVPDPRTPSPDPKISAISNG
jgi:hypothetical protein